MREFPFSFRTTKCAVCWFCSKNDEIALWSKFLTSRNLRHFRTKYFGFFFSFNRVFPFFLGPLNMLSASFGAKMPTLYSDQNSLLDSQKGIFLQTLPLFFLFILGFSTCFLDHWIYYLYAFKKKWRHCILVEILDQSELGAFLYKIKPKFFFSF